ncbi:MAG TPA: GNAT family N-acetyltransferase [Aliidongia sp.]|nr:GNAT family N-acetyltransferase [Aliidongia sp.]
MTDLMTDTGEAPVLKLSVEPNPTLADVGIVERGLFQFEENRLGSPEHAHFAVFLRDAGGQIQAGIDGHIMWKRLFIKTAWVAEHLRGRGIGTKLMLAAEREARERQCRCLWLTALGDHACHFYERLDYKIFGVLHDYVKGQSLYSLQKNIE